MASSTASKPAAKKAPAKKPATKQAPKKDQPVELTSVNDVQITVADQHATVKINGTFDLDGLIAVTKRVDRARAELA